MNIIPYIEYELLGHIGILATIIGVISFIPILHNVIITKKTNNFTYANLSLAIISNLLWIIFALNKNIFTTLFMGSIYLIIYLFILFFKVYF